MFWRVRQLFGQIKFSLWMKLQSRYFFRPFIHTWYIQLWSWWFLCHGLEDRFPKKICHVQDFWHALAKGSLKNHQLGQIYIINTWSLYSAWPCFQHDDCHSCELEEGTSDKTVLKCPGKGPNRWTCRCLHLFTQKWNLFRCHAIHPAIIWFQSLKLSFKQSWHGHGNIAALYIPCTSHTSQGSKMTVRRIRINILCDIVDLYRIGAAALACSRNN